MTRVARRIFLLVTVFPLLATAVWAEDERRPQALDPDGIERLVADSGGAARVSVDKATGAAKFVRLPVREGGLSTMRVDQRATLPEKAAAFFREYGSIFGISDLDAELKMEGTVPDKTGGAHVVYRQLYQGVPVFAGVLKAHFNSRKNLRVVNGTYVPRIELNPVPSRSAEEASSAAIANVAVDKPSARLSARRTALYVFRAGLARGVPGPNHLVWEVEVGNGTDVREFVYVDAHSGKVVDRVTGIHDALFRKAYNTTANFPNNPFWVEGDPFPTSDTEANNVIDFSGDTYNLYSHAFGRDSFDGTGGIMHGVFRRTQSCPNASWNSIFTSYCAGVSSDDVVGHEWTHAYTEFTHNLIYQWQPGALNEAYSDMYGEVVDFINGDGTDTPGGDRTDGACSAFTTLPPTVTINSPAAIAGVKNAGTAAFGPQNFTVTNDVVLANDGDTAPADGCCAGPSFVCAPNSWSNAAAIAGKFAMVDRGVCGFVVKVKNAQVNGAVGVIVANNQGGTAIINMAGVDPTVTIPSLSVTQNDGTAIKAQLVSTTVNATLSRGAGSDDSYRWLVGEDSTAFGGAIRDMWTPTCNGAPGKVSDSQYACSTADSGGVHTNSGVPNHAFALLVDGGTYNGQTVAALGLTKVAHIYFRAMTVYQTQSSDFADHADAIEQSCSDLIGVNLADLSTGGLSGQVLSASDCDAVSNAADAVELRTPPTQCNFQPLLAQDPPPLCEAGGLCNPALP